MTECEHQSGQDSGRRLRLATVTVERPRCPECRGVKLTKYRTLNDQGDGSALWWVKCKCGKRFRVVLE